MQLIQHCGVFNWRLWGFIKCVTMSWLFFEGQSNNRSMHVKSKPILLDTELWKLLSWVTFRVQQRVIYLVVIKIRRSVRRISMNGLHREPRSCIKCIFSECGLYECRRFQVFLDAFFKNTALGISVEGVECSWKAALVDIFCAWL